MFNVGDEIIIKRTGQQFTVTKVDVGPVSMWNMVRVLDNNVPKWYYESEVKSMG